jgi:hypothetical protein
MSLYRVGCGSVIVFRTWTYHCRAGASLYFVRSSSGTGALRCFSRDAAMRSPWWSGGGTWSHAFLLHPSASSVRNLEDVSWELRVGEKGKRRSCIPGTDWRGVGRNVVDRRGLFGGRAAGGWLRIHVAGIFGTNEAGAGSSFPNAEELFSADCVLTQGGRIYQTAVEWNGLRTTLQRLDCSCKRG